MDGANQTPGSEDSWQFQPNDEAVSPYVPQVLEPSLVAAPRNGPDGSITWTASEFIAHHKDKAWYGALAGCAVAAAIAVWLIADLVSAVFVIIAAIIFGVFAARQPRELIYRLDNHGLSIGPRQFGFADFRSFSVMRQGAFPSIEFMPMKRFAQVVTIYYDPQDEPKIVNLLTSFLPKEARTSDAIDRLMWRIRF